MKKSLTILKVKDITDSYYKQMEQIFDMPFRLLINGKSQYTGKSTMILNLLLRDEFYNGLFLGENIHIFSNNKLDNKMKIMAEQMDIPESNINEFDNDLLEVLYDHMSEQFMEETMDGGKPPNRLIIFDDCGYSGGLSSYKKVNIINKMICQGRHLNLSQIYTSQKYSQCSTTLRTNITGAILFGTNSRELDAIADDFSMFDNKKDFINLFRKTTASPRSFMVCDYSKPPKEMYLDSNFQTINWMDVYP